MCRCGTNTGETAKNMVADIQAAGGIITLDDLANYRVQWEGRRLQVSYSQKSFRANDTQAEEPGLHSDLVPSSGIRSNSLLYLGSE